MTLQLLEAGLQKLINDNDTKYAADAKQAIAEIREIQQRVGRQDVFKGDCYVLHADTAIDLMNTATYDEYGRLYRKAAEIKHDVSFNGYESACRHRLGLEYAPLSIIQTGYGVISDLYEDNEANGCHAADGTFIHQPPIDLVSSYTAPGLRILFEEIDKLVADWNDVLKDNADDETAIERIAVLSALHETLRNLI